MPKEEIEIVYPTSQTVWRKWLEENHQSKHAVWLVFYTKVSSKRSISWSEAVDVALCYGWIDSKKIKVDAETAHQYFSRRKPSSTWSKVNKDKVQTLIENGLMTQAGLKSIETAKRNGSWAILDEVEELKIPQDLELAFNSHDGSKEFFSSLSKSGKKRILAWIVLAKLPETRQKRITEVVVNAQRGQKPQQLR